MLTTAAPGGISSAAWRLICQAVFRFSSSSSSKRSGSTSNSPAGLHAATLLTSVSRDPSASWLASTARLQSSSSETSARTGTAVPPDRVISATVRSAASASRSITATRAPCWASRRLTAQPTVPSPSPRPPPPVTATVRPAIHSAPGGASRSDTASTPEPAGSAGFAGVGRGADPHHHPLALLAGVDRVAVGRQGRANLVEPLGRARRLHRHGCAGPLPEDAKDHRDARVAGAG